MAVARDDRYVTYRDMDGYVRAITDKLEEHMDAHDKWHLTQLVTARNLIISEFIAAIAVMVAAGTLIASLVQK